MTYGKSAEIAVPTSSPRVSAAAPLTCTRSVIEALLRWLQPVVVEDTELVINSRSASSSPVGYRFPREVIAVAVHWYLRYGLSYRDVEELLAERGVVVDHVTVYCWVQTFTPEFIDAAPPSPPRCW
jgi:hypothetical protein